MKIAILDRKPGQSLSSFVCMWFTASIPWILVAIFHWGMPTTPVNDIMKLVGTMMLAVCPLLVALAWHMGRMDLFDQLRETAEEHEAAQEPTSIVVKPKPGPTRLGRPFLKRVK